jgi:hypothetical protein
MGIDGVRRPKSVPFFKSGLGKADLSVWGVNRSARVTIFYETIFFDLLRTPLRQFQKFLWIFKSFRRKKGEDDLDLHFFLPFSIKNIGPAANRLPALKCMALKA